MVANAIICPIAVNMVDEPFFYRSSAWAKMGSLERFTYCVEALWACPGFR